MKKLFGLILVGILIMSAAWAEEIDLSGLSLRELEALRNRCLLEMFAREDWQEVSVPQGVYISRRGHGRSSVKTGILPASNGGTAWPRMVMKST